MCSPKSEISRNQFMMRWVLLLFSQIILAIKPVSSIDLKRYSGLWYEIAHLPDSFETHCVQNTSEYKINKKGSFVLIKKCFKKDGRVVKAKAISRIEKNEINSKLSINFMPSWLLWSGIGWEDHWIIDIDPHYQYAVISVPEKNYLWILSRKPSMPQPVYEGLLAKLEAFHFHLSHLIVSGEIVSTTQNSKQLEPRASLYR